MVGAIVGFDQFNNPAPFSTAGRDEFVLNDVADCRSCFWCRRWLVTEAGCWCNYTSQTAVCAFSRLL